MFAETLSVSASIHQILPLHETNSGVGWRNRRSKPRQLVEFALESHAPRQGHHPRWARNFCFLLTSESNLRENRIRLRRRAKSDTQPGLEKSLLLDRRLQHYHRRLRPSGAWTLSKSARMVAAIRQSLHCAIDQIRREAPAGSRARLHAFHRILGRRTYERSRR